MRLFDAWSTTASSWSPGSSSWWRSGPSSRSCSSTMTLPTEPARAWRRQGAQPSATLLTWRLQPPERSTHGPTRPRTPRLCETSSHERQTPACAPGHSSPGRRRDGGRACCTCCAPGGCGRAVPQGRHRSAEAVEAGGRVVDRVLGRRFVAERVIKRSFGAHSAQVLVRQQRTAGARADISSPTGSAQRMLEFVASSGEGAAAATTAAAGVAGPTGAIVVLSSAATTSQAKSEPAPHR